ncbi:MAG TPA: hypothetical protein VGO62_10940, partial [Myxococcota bacterium]
LFAWRSRDPRVDTFVVADALERAGWHVDRQHKPASVHLTVTANHAPVVDDYLRDLGAAVTWARNNPRSRASGNAAMYGLMAKVPARFLVKGAVMDAMKGMYGAASSTNAADPMAPPPGVVGALLEKHGDRVQQALDVVDGAREVAAALRTRAFADALDTARDVVARVRAGGSR